MRYCIIGEEETVLNVNRFNAAIALKGEKRTDAAKVMNMHPTTLFRKVQGKLEFDARQIELFCTHYDVDPNDIFFTRNNA